MINTTCTSSDTKKRCVIPKIRYQKNGCQTVPLHSKRGAVWGRDYFVLVVSLAEPWDCWVNLWVCQGVFVHCLHAVYHAAWCRCGIQARTALGVESLGSAGTLWWWNRIYCNMYSNIGRWNLLTIHMCVREHVYTCAIFKMLKLLIVNWVMPSVVATMYM